MRPKYPKSDSNHKLVSKVMKEVYGAEFHYGAWYGRISGKSIIAMDTSKLGGSLLDWVILIDNRAWFVEIKQPGKESTLTDGEKYFFRNSEANKAVVTSEQMLVDFVSAWLRDNGQT